MEKEIFSAEVQVRRIGERRYGKGTLAITDKNLHLNYKKFLSKRQTVTIPRDQIAKTEFRSVEMPFEIIGPFPQRKFGWVIFAIKLKDGTGFEFFVGDVSMMTPEGREEFIAKSKYKKIQELLGK